MIIRNIETKEDKIEKFNNNKIQDIKVKSNGDLIKTQKEELEYLEFLEEENLRQSKLTEDRNKKEVY